MKDYIQDLTKYVVSTGFFDKIKITADQKAIKIEALEKEKEVVAAAKWDIIF